MLTRMALQDMPEVVQLPSVETETLELFLQQERHALVELLKNNEQWSRANIRHYPPSPEILAFKEGDNQQSLSTQFSAAIRINPVLKFPLFVQYPITENERKHQKLLPASTAMLKEVEDSKWIYLANGPFESLAPGQKISALDVVSSAADEPDYGMDMGLWEDNAGDIGELYKWGKQPMGDSTLFLGSQGPFHVAYFHESPWIYFLAPHLEYCFPEYRIHLFLELSRHAFRSQHHYWGWRFLGWALHYVQDLTQPYHTSLAPNVSTVKLMSIGMLDKLGISGPAQNLFYQFVNRHFSLENYAYHLLNAHVTKGGYSQPVYALADSQNDGQYLPYTHNYPRWIIAKEAHSYAQKTDNVIKESLPERYMGGSQVAFFQGDPEPNLHEILKAQKARASQLEASITQLLHSFGAHSRNVVRYSLAAMTSSIP